jgi:hypothetical protein
MDWGAWSREAVSMMSARTTALLAKHALPTGAPYRWQLDRAVLVVGDVEFPLVTVGTVAGDSFMWGWANEAIPAVAKRGLERVRAFGETNDLGLLCSPCVPGGLAQAKQCVALAGRVLDAAGVWLDATAHGHIAFVLGEANRGA